MAFENAKRRWLRIVLLCVFAAAGAGSLHESWQIYVLTRYAMNLDQMAPHLGDVELPDEHRHARYMYPFTFVALGCAYGLYRTRKKTESPANKVGPGLGGT